MTDARRPFLWLFGPSGVGKTTIAAEIFDRLAESGVRVAHVDADMLGMFWPAPEDDPDEYRLKGANLGAVWKVFREAGAQCLVMSGGIEHGREVALFADQVPDTELTLVRLRVDEAEHRARIAGRGGSFAAVADQLVEEAAVLDGTDFADLCVDVGGLDVAEAARSVLKAAGGWPSRGLDSLGPGDDLGESDIRHLETRPASDPSLVSTAPMPVLLLHDPTAKTRESAVGWFLYSQTREHRAAAYVDLPQLGFLASGPEGGLDDVGIRALNLRAMIPVFRAEGAQCVVAFSPTGNPEEFARYAEILTGAVATVTMCRHEPGIADSASDVARRLLADSGWPDSP